MTPADIIAAARAWIGTPYHHQAAVRGVGCDCLGLVRGVYAELYGRAPEEPPAYTRDLAEATGAETLLEAARRHLVEIAPADVAAFAAGRDQQAIAPGDVVVFRLRPGAMAKHCGILSGAPGIRPALAHLAVGPEDGATRNVRGWTMIHAFEGGPVCEVSLCNWWRRRIAAAFSWPRQV